MTHTDRKAMIISRVAEALQYQLIAAGVNMSGLDPRQLAVIALDANERAEGSVPFARNEYTEGAGWYQ